MPLDQAEQRVDGALAAESVEEDGTSSQDEGVLQERARIGSQVEQISRRESIDNSLLIIKECMDQIGSNAKELRGDNKEGFLKLREKFDGVCKMLADTKIDNISGTRKVEGAIPKLRSGRIKLKEEESASTTDEECSADSSTETSSESSDSERKRRKIKIRKKTTGRRYIERDEISDMIRYMGARKIPTMEDYDENSGMDFVQYLEDFQTYCEQVIPGKTKFWIPELQSKLTGNVLKVFKSGRTNGDTWKRVKKRLVKWYKSDAQFRKTKFKTLFEQAKPEGGESLFMLAIRMQSLFKMAFPKRGVDTSKTLTDKYLSVIPSDALSIFRAQQAGLKHGGHRIKWEKVKEIASFCDGCREYTRKSLSRDRDEIVIQLGVDNSDKLLEGDNKSQGNYQSGYFRKFNGRTFNRSNSVDAPTYHNDSPARRSPPPLLNRRPIDRSMPARSPSANLQQRRNCYHCGRVGHVVANCRVRQRACFACGQTSHFIADCPNEPDDRTRRNNDSQITRVNNNRYQRQRSVSFSQNNRQNEHDNRENRNKRQENEDALTQWGDGQGN